MQEYYGGSPQTVKKSGRKIITSIRFDRILIIIAVIAVIVALSTMIYAKYFSGIFTVSGRTYYAIEFYSHETKAEAEESAEYIKLAGGAGYILNDASFRVIAAVYKTNTEAESVLNKQEEGKAKLYKIKIDDVKITKNNDDADDEIRNALNNYSELFDSMQTLLFDYDKGTQTESVVLASALSYKNKADIKLKNLQLLATKTESEDLSLIIDFYQNLVNITDEIVDGVSYGLSVKLKYALVDIIYQRKLLSVALNSK